MSLYRSALLVSMSASAMFGAVLVPSVHAEVTSTVIVAPVVSPTILKMADGRFYHPASGLIMADENALRAQLGIPVPVENALPVVLQAVYRAQAELEKQITAEGKNTRYPMGVVGQDAPRAVTLAVWNKGTDEISYVSAIKTGKDLDIGIGSPVGIKVRLANWINTDYVTNDSNHVVVAVRYPIFHEIKKGTKVVEYSVEEAVYTPYNGALVTPEVIIEGERVLDEYIAKATSELVEKKVGSRALSGKNVTETISPDLVKALIVAEHTNTSSLRSNPKSAIGQIYATVALNPGEAYNYSGSSAGALGLAQFIPSTYNRLAKRTELGLKPDFEAGMRDHQNAIKASFAYLDAVLGELPAEAKNLDANDPRLFEYLAAAYNGGSSKVKRAILIWDEQISGELSRGQILSRARLQPETIDYVKKIRAALPVILGQQPQRLAGET
jgi:hypothetical protein